MGGYQGQQSQPYIHYQDQNPSSHSSANNNSPRDLTNRASATLTVGQPRESLIEEALQRTITTGSNQAHHLGNEDLMLNDDASSLGLSDPL